MLIEHNKAVTRCYRAALGFIRDVTLFKSERITLSYWLITSSNSVSDALAVLTEKNSQTG